MDSRRFDALTRALGTPGSRRATLGALLGSALGTLTLGGPASPEAAARKKRRRRKSVTKEGPCGNGSGKANRCKRNRQCCTGYCDKGKKKRKRRKVQGRCRCRKAGQSCSEDRNCCVERTGRVCQEGACQTPLCADLCPDGCCDGETCLAGDSDQACGTGGATCQSCELDAACEAGVCELLPCAERCTDGCCAGETCGAGNTPEACGPIGEACQVCSGATPVCFNGACVCGDVCADGCQFTSLQDAITAASAEDTIRLCAATYPGTITIAKNLTLSGAGDGEQDGTILHGQDNGRVVTIAEGATVAFQALRVTGGGAMLIGGGILNDGNVTLTDCTVSGNMVDISGGGIYNEVDASLTCTNSHITGNMAGLHGGGIYNDRNASLTCTNSHVTGNTVAGGGDGGGIYNLEGTVTLNVGSLVCGNTLPQCVGFSDPNGACQDTCPP